MENKKNNWIQIIVTALLTGVVTVIAGMILFNLQISRPKLTFYTPETSPFQGTGKNFAIYNVSITNGGGTNIGNVVGVIQIPNSSIDDMKVTTTSSLKYKTNIASDTLTIEIPDINPSETLSISILASSQSTMRVKPNISIRGTGITGEEILAPDNGPVKSEFSFQLITLFTMLVAVASISSSIIGTGIFSSRISGLPIPILNNINNYVFGKHKDDQNKILAYLCGIHGLIEDTREYLLKQNDTAYWSESDRFASIAIFNNNSDEIEKRKNVLIDLLIYTEMASLSKAIVNYNIARMLFVQNNIGEANR